MPSGYGLHQIPFIKSLRVSGLLSFPADGAELDLRPFNVLIGPNGAGKSNLVEAISLLTWAPRDIASGVRNAGGISLLMHSDGVDRVSHIEIEAVIQTGWGIERRPRPWPIGTRAIRYRLRLANFGDQVEVVDERIESEKPVAGNDRPFLYFGYESGRPMVSVKKEKRALRREEVNPQQSILAQRRDPDGYPELTWLAEFLGSIRLYRDWTTGKNSPGRFSQQGDLRSSSLDEDYRNLALVLSSLNRRPEVKKKLISALRMLIPTATGYFVHVEASRVQLFLQEGETITPANRLSDGTLRWLSLFAALNPSDPFGPVIIEEPELGLHPDALAQFCPLAADASSRQQVLLTTHSEAVVNGLNETPEAIVIVEKHNGGTRLNRLSKENMASWLAKYSLGELWAAGHLG